MAKQQQLQRGLAPSQNESIDINITIQAKGFGTEQITQGSSGAVSNEVSNSNAVSSNQTNEEDKKTGASKAKQAGETIGISLANNLMIQAEFEMSFWLQKTDNYVAQRNLQYAREALSNTTSFVSSVAKGAAAGGAWGAAAAAIVSGVSMGVNAVKGMRQQDFLLEQMENQLQFTRRRIGWSTEAASIGEDL